jgi:hypothetical protein
MTLTLLRRDRAAVPTPLPESVRVSRWHQRLAVALDAPLEQLDPGAERLPAVVTAYLDVQRATDVRPVAGPLLLAVLEEDLAHLGAVAPRRAATDLLAELVAVVALEDAAGRALPEQRAALLPATATPVRARRSWRPCARPALSA